MSFQHIDGLDRVLGFLTVCSTAMHTSGSAACYMYRSSGAAGVMHGKAVSDFDQHFADTQMEIA